MGKTLKVAHQYSFAEELFNSISHGVGTLLSLVGLTVLIVMAALKGADAWSIVSFSIYGGTLIFLYLSSTLYHSLTHPKAKQIFRKFDHISIFLFIAGSYTPVTLIMMRENWGWPISVSVWVLAILGIVITIIGIDRFQHLSTALCLVMGWLIIIAIKPMLASVPPGFFPWMLTSGIFYTLGVIFFVGKKIPFNHGIWHIFVLFGSASYFIGIMKYFI